MSKSSEHECVTTLRELIKSSPQKTREILDKLKEIRKNSEKGKLIENLEKYVHELQEIRDVEALQKDFDLRDIKEQVDKMSKFKKSKKRSKSLRKTSRKTSRKSPTKPRRKSNQKKL